MPKRLYISGPMTGIDDYNRPAFHAMELALTGAGLEVYNPASVLLDTNDWAEYMKIHLQELPKCGMVVVLPGWQKSKGARLEVTNAFFLGIPVKCWPEMADLVENVEIRIFRTYDGLMI